jgi:hypothetical protein
MKKLMAASVLALLVLASSQQSASAWCHCKFGVGLNFEFSSGNNCCLWGAFRNGPTPDGWGPLCGPGGGPVAGPMADWYAPAPTPLQRPQSSPATSGGSAYAGYYYNPNPYYYQPQANPYQYANYPANNPFGYYLMSYPGAGYYSQGGMNFYGQ